MAQRTNVLNNIAHILDSFSVILQMKSQISIVKQIANRDLLTASKMIAKMEVKKELEDEEKEKKKVNSPKPKKPAEKKEPEELKSLQEYDELGYFKSPTPAILSGRTDEIRKVSPDEIQNNIDIIPIKYLINILLFR